MKVKEKYQVAEQKNVMQMIHKLVIVAIINLLLKNVVENYQQRINMLITALLPLVNLYNAAKAKTLLQQ
jgi:hypothetical protein